MTTSAGTSSKAALRTAACVLASAFLAVVLSSCSWKYTEYRYHEPPKRAYAVASWYGPKFHGRLTASGERFDMHALTAAHRSYPFGTRLKVTGVKNGKSVMVTVNDRGPFIRGRDIDLSYGAAKKIGLVGPGTAKVRLDYLGRDSRYVKYIRYEGHDPGQKGPFTIQVASFSERFNALHLEKGLRLSHSRTYIVKASVNGRRYWRVRVGKFATRGQAEDYARRLTQDGYTALVLRYDKEI